MITYYRVKKNNMGVGYRFKQNTIKDKLESNRWTIEMKETKDVNKFTIDDSFYDEDFN